MEKKLLIILLIAVTGLIFFNSDFCFALDAPTNPTTTDIGEGYAVIQWEWEGDDAMFGMLKSFHIQYREKGSVVWMTADHERGTGEIEHRLQGLSGSTNYEWRVKAEAQRPEPDSPYTEPDEEFRTIQAPVLITPPAAPGGIGDITLKNPLDQESIWGAIDAVLNFLVLAALGIAPILIIYSAFLMIFAGGDAEKINRARAIISWTLIALVLILSAKILPSLIKGAFGG